MTRAAMCCGESSESVAMAIDAARGCRPSFTVVRLSATTPGISGCACISTLIIKNL